MRTGGEAGEATYDVAEVRARMALVFSLSELRQLGLRLGMAEVPLDRGAKEAARDIVRFADKSGMLGALLEALREARPLVEWPEPTSGEAASSPYAPPEAAREGDAPPLLASPGSLVGGTEKPLPNAGSAALRPDAGAGELASALHGAPGGSGSPAPPPRTPEGPPLPDPYEPAAPAAGWPGTAPSPAAARAEPKGLDPRILVVVSATMLLAAALAFAAGRAFSARGERAAEAPAEVSAASGSAPSRDPHGPSARVAAAFERALGNVARICEIPKGALAGKGGGAGVIELERAFERCGPAPLAPRLPVPDPGRRDPAGGPGPPPAGADGARDPGAGRPAAAAPRPVGKTADAAKPDPAGADTGCLSACQSSHQRCKSGCGPEPTLSSKYGEYQACQSKCLSAASRCRLACP